MMLIKKIKVKEKKKKLKKKILDRNEVKKKINNEDLKEEKNSIKKLLNKLSI